VKLIFADEAWEDNLYRQKQDRRMVERINKLIRETQRESFAGVGKPEPLKHALSGYWSRRITDEHRIVYRVEEDALLIAQLRFHY
jgi:toxin YoeB